MAKVSLDSIKSRKIILRKKKRKTQESTTTLDLSKCPHVEGTIVDMEVTDFTKDALFEYGSYVVQDRAIPDFRDGLKPSHRAILWSAFNLGLSYSSGVKKAARTVGDAIGKYHPHGDAACYGAMVTLANTAVPAIHGQGNWGTPLAPAAAMRYTEGKLSKFSTMFLMDRKYLSVTQMVPNYSEDAEQPLYLPALLPVILLFGNPTVPAYGVRAGNPSFSFRSVAKVTLNMLRGKTYTHKTLARDLDLRHFYGCNVVSDESEILTNLETGKGSIRYRPIIEASWEKKRIYIKSFAPGGTSGAFDSCSSIDKQFSKIQDFKGVSSISTENSKRNPNSGPLGVFYVITPVRGIKEDDFWLLVQQIEEKLTTKASYALGITVRRAPDKGKTEFFYTDYLNLMEQWVRYRISLEARLIEKLIAEAESALEIQEGYSRVCASDADLQKCIKIIRTVDDAQLKPKLMKTFDLTERQADAVLELRLRRLGKLALTEVKATIAELKARIKELKSDAKNPQLRAAQDLEERVKAYLKTPDDKVQAHIIA